MHRAKLMLPALAMVGHLCMPVGRKYAGHTQQYKQIRCGEIELALLTSSPALACGFPTSVAHLEQPSSVRWHPNDLMIVLF
jgi:hypothetical protein